MASHFTCSVTSAQTQGSVLIETLLCTKPASDGTNSVRIVEVARATFSPEKLNVIDINAKRRVLTNIYQGDRAKILSELSGIFKSTDGGTAAQALAMPDFSNSAVVVGGIYFASAANDFIWYQTGEKTKQADGFVWYKPDQKKEGHVLSTQHGNFTSGGYLRFDFEGHASIAREAPPATGDFLRAYRLIVQSNIVLVDNGQEYGNPDKKRQAVAALSAQRDGNVSLVVAAEPQKPSNGSGFTYKEFGEFLVDGGSLYAINLDGGPSVQFAKRKENCDSPENPSCIENLVHHTDVVNPMPQLFSVTK